MDSEPQSPVVSPEGQAPEAPDTGTTSTAPEGMTGQAQAPHSPDPGQATPPPATGEPTFFDPTSLAPELLPAYKMMQGRFTQGMQKVSGQEKKLQAYDMFERAPHSQEVQQLLAQYGYVPAHQAQAPQGQQQAPQQQPYEPQTWEELLSTAEERGASLAEQRILQRLAPFIGQVQASTAQTIEKQLSTIDPKWRDYEDQMKENLSRFPGMVNDPALLYRVSVPQEIFEAKVMRETLDKIGSKAQHAAVGVKSTAQRGTPATAKITSFDDAVAAAKKQLGT